MNVLRKLHKVAPPKDGPAPKPKPRGGANSLALVKFTPDEQAFLPPALEIEETAPSPLGRIVLWIVVAIALAGIVWSCIGRIDVFSTARGRVVPDGKLKVVQAIETSVITAIHVREGQRVNAGDILVELDPTIINSDKASSDSRAEVLKLELERLEAELHGTKPNYSAGPDSHDKVALQEMLRATREANHQAQMSEAVNARQSKEMALAIAQDMLAKLSGKAAIAKEKEARVRPHVGTVMPRFDYLRLQDELSQFENDLKGQEKATREAREQLAAASQRIEQLRQSRRTSILSEIAEKQRQYTMLSTEVVKATKFASQKFLRAPVSGYVQGLLITTAGGVVTPAQTIATIVPVDTPLIVEGSLSNNDVGFVAVGQSVEIKLDTYPSQKYGAIEGEVIWISPDAEQRSPSESQQPGANAHPEVFKVRIRPKRHSLNVNGVMKPILSGMSVQADIKTDDRRIIEFFFSPIKKAVQEGMGVR